MHFIGKFLILLLRSRHFNEGTLVRLSGVGALEAKAKRGSDVGASRKCFQCDFSSKENSINTSRNPSAAAAAAVAERAQTSRTY